MSIPSGDEEPIFKVLLTNSSRAKVASIIFPLTGVFKAKKCYRTLYSSLNEQHKPQPTLSIIIQVKPGRWWQLHMESNPADMRVNDFSWTAGATQLKSVPILPALVTLQTYPSSISWWTSRPQRVVGCINHLPLSSPPTPPPQSGELTCRWRGMGCHGLRHSSPQQLESSRAQPRQVTWARTPRAHSLPMGSLLTECQHLHQCCEAPVNLG